MIKRILAANNSFIIVELCWRIIDQMCIRDSNETNLTAMLETAGQRKVSHQVGEKLVDRLLEEDFLTSREGMIIKSMINDKLLGSDEKADALRGDMLNAVLLLLLRDDFV